MTRTLRYLALALFSLVPGLAQAAPPPIDAFAGEPEIAGAEISPNGTYLAVVRALSNKLTVLIYRVADLKAPPQPLTVDEANFAGMAWGSDDRVIVGAYKRTRMAMVEEPLNVVRYFAANADGSNNVVLMSGESRIFKAQLGLGIVSTTPHDPETILMSGADQKCSRGAQCDLSLNVYKVNIYTGKPELVERGNTETSDWSADAKGELRYRTDYVEGRGISKFYSRDASGTWKKLFEFSARDPHPEIEPLGPTDDPNLIYIRYEPKSAARAEIWTYDTRTAKPVERIAAHPAVDMESVAYDSMSGEPTGVGYINDWFEVEWLSDAWAEMDAKLKASFPKAAARAIVSADSTRRKLVVATQGEFDYGTWYYVDLDQGKAIEFGKSRPKLNASTIGGRKRIDYTARDGLKLRAYLTLPPGTNGKNLPMVLLPHGGPEARDVLGYDFYAHFIASRGYAVLQPQYRGSDGFGSKFTEQGYYQWGLKMQDDLSDAVKWAIAQGIADSNRVCIVGHSYGGYAALAGATLTPELYKCVVAVAGVSDLINISKREQKYGRQNPAALYWLRNIGSVAKDREKLERASPALHADQVRAPILLMHGLDDTTVFPEESKLMANALKAAGKTYEYIELPGADHQLDTQQSRTRVFTEIERWLKQYNPPN